MASESDALGGVRSAPPGGSPADLAAVRRRDESEDQSGTTRWHRDGTARDDVAGETPGALRAEADARREARAAEAEDVAVAAAIVAIVAVVGYGAKGYDDTEHVAKVRSAMCEHSPMTGSWQALQHSQILHRRS